ncbi:5-formyltetrahydrofolate cyclo-ligase [Arthrobacter sp. CAN_A214]|uniref:5-formyltetrahydrofolate cyclo-ligase n=1 Tax=Arthrobacter sp. CAN_A214 TaxID=2787720 RepID=UPI0018C9F2A4
MLTKRELRAEIRAERRQRPVAEREGAAANISTRLVSLVIDRAPRLVACYLSTDDEPGTRPFLEWAASNGVDVILPVSRVDGLLDWIPNGGGTEQLGLFGIPEIVGQPLSAEITAGVDLMIIPAAAVDRSGMRLGWGRGYFDRTLSALEHSPTVYAVVFDSEFRETVPREPHDHPVDGIVTPSMTALFEVCQGFETVG